MGEAGAGGEIAAPPRGSQCTTTLNPRHTVQRSSSTEMSNDRLVTASHTPGVSTPMHESIAAKKLVTLPCSSITPLGPPVEPEV